MFFPTLKLGDLRLIGAAAGLHLARCSQLLDLAGKLGLACLGKGPWGKEEPNKDKLPLEKLPKEAISEQHRLPHQHPQETRTGATKVQGGWWSGRGR